MSICHITNNQTDKRSHMGKQVSTSAMSRWMSEGAWQAGDHPCQVQGGIQHRLLQQEMEACGKLGESHNICPL